MVNKITTPPTNNEVIDKINELVDDKQDTITSSNKLPASLVSGLATVATSGSYADLSNKPSIDSALSTSSTNAAQNKVITSALNGKLDGYNLNVAGQWSSGVHAVNFLTFDYSSADNLNGIFIKLSMVNAHGDGVSGKFLEDIILNFNYIGTVEATIYRYFARPVDVSTSEYYGKNYGDIFWTKDTTNKIVKFYVLMRQYSYSYMTPYMRLNTSTKGTITQKTGAYNEEYSSGTRYWASTNWYETDQTYSATSPKPQSGVAVASAISGKANTADLASVATTGSYNDLSNKPTIPTVNNATLTIQTNGSNVATFTANASSNVTANISVPTKTSDLTNDSGYTTNSDIAGMYHYAGSVAFANLPTPTSSNVGSVYNVTDDFTTTSSFLEGSGKSYLAGTDVVIVRDSSGYTLYAWEVPSSGYLPPTLPSGTVIYTTNETLSPSSHIYDINGNDVTSNYVINYPNPQGFPFAYFDIRLGEPVYYYTEDEETTLITVLSRNSSLDVTGGFYFNAFSGSGYQTTSNLVTSVSSSSTDSQYPSAKLFYDTCGDIETLINAL